MLTSRDQRTVGGATAGADAWGGGRDLPSLLQEVSLKGSRDSSPVWSEDPRPAPRRRVNLFLSLRLRKQGDAQGKGRGHATQAEIGAMLANIRNGGKCDTLTWEEV